MHLAGLQGLGGSRLVLREWYIICKAAMDAQGHVQSVERKRCGVGAHQHGSGY